jgi:hypothetical protein
MSLLRVLAKATYATNMTYRLLVTAVLIVQLVKTVRKK